jgi:hypothetical protein
VRKIQSPAIPQGVDELQALVMSFVAKSTEKKSMPTVTMTTHSFPNHERKTLAG